MKNVKLTEKKIKYTKAIVFEKISTI